MEAEEQFRNALDTVISEAFDDGLSYDAIISELELRLVSLREEELEDKAGDGA